MHHFAGMIGEATTPGFAMTQKLPPLAWLRAFEAAARHLSFTTAAEELNLTQAAISKQVKMLELHLGERLFERKARSLALTRVGAAWLPKLQDGFERLTAGTREVFGGRRAEMLTIRAPVSFAVTRIAPRLPDFYARFPKVQLRILSSVWSEDVDAVKYDLDIRYGLGHWPGFRADQLGREKLEPLCTPEIAERLKRPDDLAGERLLHVLGYQQGWADWLAAAGASSVNPGSGAHFDTTLLAFEAAASGVGVALGRSSMIGAELARGRLIRPFQIAAPIAEAFWLLSPEAGMIHPDAASFREWIIAEAVNPS